MAEKRWNRHELGFDDLWVKDDRVYRTIGFVDDPMVVIRDVESGETEHHVVQSLNFAAYSRFVAVRSVGPSGGMPGREDHLAEGEALDG